MITFLSTRSALEARNSWRRSSGYLNTTTVTVTAGEQHDITCESYGARPPVVLDWEIPGDVSVILGMQSNVVKGNSYVSRKVATIMPSRNDQGKNLRCVESHPQLQYSNQRSVYLNVQGRDRIITLKFDCRFTYSATLIDLWTHKDRTKSLSPQLHVAHVGMRLV